MVLSLLLCTSDYVSHRGTVAAGPLTPCVNAQVFATTVPIQLGEPGSAATAVAPSPHGAGVARGS